MEFKKGWNNRILIVDDQEEIHQDFEEMLNPDFTAELTDDLARAFDSEVDESFLPELELQAWSRLLSTGLVAGQITRAGPASRED